MQIVIMAEHEQ